MKNHLFQTLINRLSKQIAYYPILLLCAASAAFANQSPPFKMTSCPTTFATSHPVVCGIVKVPAQYLPDNKQWMHIDVAIIHSPGNQKKTPVLYLEGGPGGNGLIPFDQPIFQIAKKRDLVLIAQRGTGFSATRSYACDGFNVFGQHASDGMVQCRNSLLATGLNFQAMTVRNSAEDIYSVIKALHYDSVDLYGFSYGTDLALEVMKLHPNVIHSVVLDSVIPPHIYPLTQAGPDGLETIQTLLNDCATDKKCHDRYPQLARDFYDLVNKISVQPITLHFPYAGQMLTVQVSVDVLLDSISGNYSGIVYLPKAIHELANSDCTQYTFDHFGNAITQVFKPVILAPKQFNIATFWLTACQSVYAGESNQRIEFANQYLPTGLKNFYNAYGEGELANCHLWFPHHDETMPSHTPVDSAIPTLILSGQYDGALDSTPAAWAKSTAAHLTHSYFYSFPRTGHISLSAGACPLKIMNEFLKYPRKTPDARCIQLMNKDRRFVTR